MKIVILLGLSFLLASSCTTNNICAPIDSRELTISSPANHTRASGATWHRGDEVGVMVRNTGNGYDPASDFNVRYKNNNEDGLTAIFYSTNAPQYPSSGSVDLLAYYPYHEDLNSMSYAVDVSSQDDIASIDLMVASKDEVAVNTAPVVMQFRHCLSSIELTLTSGEGLVNTETFEEFQALLVGAKTTAIYNLETGDISNLASIEAIVLKQTEGLKFQGIVIPQELTGAVLLFQHPVLGIFEHKIPTTNYVAGTKYSYEIKITATKNSALAADVTCRVSSM